MNETFIGCLRNFKVNSKDLGNPSRKFGVSRCSEKVEEGAFFYGNGGYIRLCKLIIIICSLGTNFILHLTTILFQWKNLSLVKKLRF